jgi:glutamyl-tRNA(Gln) amidotransferase subunit D
MANIGDKVKIKTLVDETEGTLLPAYDDKIVLLKLSNGYNVGFERKNILSMQIISEKKTSVPSAIDHQLQHNKQLKTVTILHCGGTIASKVDYETGAVKAKFSPQELLEMFPELGQIVNLRSSLVANMMSENMRFAHYNQIAQEIEQEIKNGTDGIIITHGTDTLHYTAAALSFMLENLPIPVILVGAQRSSDRGSSDAFLNLKSAVNFIANSDFGEVAICMHHSENDDSCAVLPATRSRKMHSSRRDAFKAINSEPHALIGSGGDISWINSNYLKVDKTRKLLLRLFNEKLKIGFLRSHPQMFAEEIRAYAHFDGLVLEATGLGHFPTERYDELTSEHDLIYQEIKELAKKMPLVMAPQTIYGAINMNVYSPGRRLIEAGVLGNSSDLTAETTFIKLAWLLSNHPQHVKEMFSQNLRGEISSSRHYKKDFID